MEVTAKAPFQGKTLVPTENLKKLHDNLSKIDGFNVPYEQFESDMQDENNLKRLHDNLAKQQDFTVPYDQFKADMFSGQSEATEQPEQPLTYMQKELRQKFPENYTEEQKAGANSTTLSNDSEVQIPRPVQQPVKPLGKVDQLKVDYLRKARGEEFANQEQAKMQAPEQPEEQGFASKLGKTVGNSFMTGINSLNSWAADAPGFIYDLAGAPFRAVGLNVPTSQDFKDTPLQNISSFYKDNAKAYEQKVQESNPSRGQGVVASFEKGDIEGGILNLAGGIAESAPASIAMMLSGGATAPTILGGAAIFGAGKAQEMDQNATEMDYDKRRVVAAINGTLEGIFETYLGSGAVGKSLAGIIKNEGKEVAQEQAKRSLSTVFADMITKNPWMAPLGEGFEEIGTQISQNLVDKYSGYKPDLDIMDGVGDSFLSGVGMGGIHGAVIGLAKSAMDTRNATPITTATIEGQQYTINNPEDLGIEGKPIFAKDAEGNIIPVSGKKKDLIADVVTQAQGELDQAQQAAADQQALMNGIADPNAQVINDENFEDEGTRIVDFSNGQSKIIYNGQEVIANDVNEKDVILNSINDFQKLPEPKPIEEVKPAEPAKPIYTFNGTEISKEEAHKRADKAILLNDKTKLDGLEHSDQDIYNKIDKQWPKPPTVLKIKGKKVNQKQALDFIEVADDMAELSELKHENIESDPIVAKAYEEKLSQFTEAERMANERKQADTDILLDILDEYNATPQSREDKQKGSEIESIAKKLGYQTERNVMNQIRLFDNSGTISKPKISENANNSEQQTENIPENIDQNAVDQFNALFETENNQQINELQNEDSEKVIQPTAGIVAEEGENTPQAQQGEGVEEGLEENVNQNISTDQPVVESLTADPVDEQKETREQLEVRLLEERKQRILTEGTGFDKEFGLIPPSDIKSADDIISNIDKILSTLKANEGNKKYDIFEGYVYGSSYAKNAGEQIRGYFHALDVLPNEIRKEFASKINATTVQGLMDWASKQYKDIIPVAEQIAQQEVNLNPTEAQKEAGNYKMAHVKVQGMDISIENPKGSFRKGVDEDGKAWETEMKSHYGYFKGTVGKDGDHVDTFIGENPESQMIFVVDQNNPKTGKFDESKVMTGFNTIEEAKAAYLANYELDWKGFGSITPVPVEQFKIWLNDGLKQHKPFSEYKSTPDPVEVADELPGVGKDLQRSEPGVNGENEGEKGSEVEVKEPWQMTFNEYLDENLKRKENDPKLFFNPITHKYESQKSVESSLYGQWSKLNEQAFIDGKSNKKPAWARTLKEHVELNGEGSEQEHKLYIEQALSEGKPVPQEVLNDYPELQVKKPLYEVLSDGKKAVEEKKQSTPLPEEKQNEDDIRFRTEDQSKIIKDALKYSDVNDFIDAYKDADFRDSHSAPGNSMSDMSLEERMDHGDDFNLTEVVQGFSVQPKDYFDPRNGARWYGYDDKEGMQSYYAIKSVMSDINGQIEKNGKITKIPKIKAYRAVPKGVEVNDLIDGDWITFSKEYAKGHGENRFGRGEYKIISQNITANDVWWDGNDINEWGYDTGKTEKLGRSDLKAIWENAHAANRFRILGETGAANLDKAEEATTRLDNLAIAREMEILSKDAKTISLATGWEKGVDGKWRYEAPDSELSENYQEAETLEQAINDPELFKSYPELKDIRIGALSAEEYENSGVYMNLGLENMPTIYAGGIDKENLKSVLAHEVQHAIQDIEGFARGGSANTGAVPNEINSKLKEIDGKIKEIEFEIDTNEDNQDLIYELDSLLDERKKFVNKNLSQKALGKYYKRLAGEVESRNVQSRMNMTPEERRNTLLQETEDVAREDQIVLMDGLGSSSLESNPIQSTIDHLQSTDSNPRKVNFDTKENLIQYMKDNDYPQNILDQIELINFGGVLIRGEIFMDSGNVNTPDKAVINWLHERTHVQTAENMTRPELVDFYHSIGPKEIRRVIPSFYWNKPYYEQADEYISYASEGLSTYGELDQNIPEHAKEIITNIVSGFTTPKNLKDATKSNNLDDIQSGNTRRNVRRGNNDGRGNQESEGTSEIGKAADGRSLPENEKRSSKGLTISTLASQDLSKRHNASNIITKLSNELGEQISVVNSSELAKNSKDSVVLYDNGKLTIVSDRIKSVSDVVKSILHEVAVEKGLRNILSQADSDSNIGRQLPKFDELNADLSSLKENSPEADRLAQIFRKAFSLTSGQFSNSDLLNIVKDQQTRLRVTDEKNPTINIDGIERSTLNSNGKPIANSEEGIRNFWKWFGDSKVVDSEGRPLVVYHGTNMDGISVFEPRNGALGKGTYFTSVFEEAADYAAEKQEIELSEDNDFGGDWLGLYIYEAYLNINDESQISYSGYGDGHIYVANPSQIKSATGNNGSFSPESNDIRFQIVKDEALNQLKEDLDKITALQKSTVRLNELEDSKSGKTKVEKQTIVNQISKYKEGYRTGVSEKRLTLYVIQRNIIKYASDNMNYDQATKGEINQLLTAIKNANTPATISKAFDRIDEIVTKMNTNQERNGLNKDIEALIRQATSPKRSGTMTMGKFNIDDVRQFAIMKKYNDEAIRLSTILRSNVAQVSDKIAAGKELDRIWDEVNAIEDKTIIDEVTLKIIDWRRSGSKVSVQLLTAIRDDLELLYKQAKDAKTEEDIKIAIVRKNEREFISKFIRDKKYDKSSLAKRFNISLNNFTANVMGNWETVMTMLGGVKLREKTSLIMPQVHQEMGVHNTFNEVLNKAYKAYGFKSKQELLLHIQDLSKKDFELIQPNFRGGKVEGAPDKISMMQIMDIYNAIKNTGIEKDWYMSYGDIVLDSSGKTDIDIQMSTGRARIEKLINKLSAGDKKFADMMMDKLQEYSPQTNEVFVKLFNMDRKSIEVYWPSSALLETDVDVMEQFFEEGKIPSFFKDRAAHRTPVPKDAFGKFTQHVKESEWIVNMALPLNELNKTFRNSSVKKLIEQNRGNKYYGTIKQHLQKVGLRPTTKDLTDFERIGGSILSNWVVAKIGLSVSVPIKQLIGAVNYAENMPAEQWLVGFAKAVADPKGTFDEVWENCPYLQVRFNNGYSEALQYVMNATSNLPKANNWHQAIKNIGTLGTRAGDMATLIYGGKPYVDYLIKNGISKKDAYDKFIIETLRAQQSGLTSTLSIYQNSNNPFARALFTFSNTPSQYMRKMFEANQAFRHGDINAKQLTKVYSIYAVANSILYVGAGMLISAMLTGDEPEDEWEKMAIQGVLSFVGGLPLINDLAESTTRQALGLKVYDDALPVLVELNDIRSKLIKTMQSGDGLDPQAESDKKKVYLKDAVISILELGGISAGNAERMYDATINRDNKAKERRSEDARAIISEASKYHKFLLESIKREDTELHDKLMSNKPAFGAVNMLVVSDPESGRKSYDSRITNLKKYIKYWKHIKTDEAAQKVDEYELMLENTYKEIIDRYSEIEFPDSYKLKK